MLCRSGCLLLLLVALVGGATAAPPSMTSDQARSATNDVIRLIEEKYVFPDKRAAIASALKQHRDAGRYDVANPSELGERITADLRAVSNDGHLSLSYDPEEYKALRHPSADAPRGAFGADAGRLRNDGYEELKVLAGNVRYVRITNFLWFGETTPRIVDAAARFLADGDAVIVDLRGDGGGSAEAVQRIVSYFFPGGGQELIHFHDGLSGETDVVRVLTDLPSPRLHGKPLFTLTDAGTASAAEEFAYHVQQFNLGTLVGRTTAGAANNNELYSVAPYFVASISVGRPEHPVSHTNWEGVGIAPHVEISTSTAALDQAHLLALQTLARRADARRRVDYEWEIAAAETKLNPVRPPPAALDAFVGVYGARRIWREGATLWFQRDKREPRELIAMRADLFGLSGTTAIRLKFKRERGRVVAFDRVTKDGVIGTIARTQ